MKEGNRFPLFLITPNGDFVMSAKRIEIANKLIVDFPSGRATQAELMEWAETNGYSKYAPSFVWKSEYRVDRGIFRIPTETEIKTGTLDVPMELVAAETAKTEEEADAWLRGEEGAMRPPELLTRDVVARAIMAEVKEGRGSPHGGAFLDIASRQPADYIQRKLPSMYHQFKELATLDITEEPMEVGPTTHYMMGGIKVDAGTAASTIDGLYAAGEAAAGMHGANRLGGNSLSDLLVFGKIAGQSASNYAQENSHISPHGDEIKKGIDNVLKPFEEGSENPYEIHKELQDVMETHAGIVRTGEELEKGIQKLEKIRKKLPNLHSKGDRRYNPGWHLCLDLHNMVITSLALAKAALERNESRGAHTRLDYPDYDEDLGKVNMIIRTSSDVISVFKSPMYKMPDDLKDYVSQEAV